MNIIILTPTEDFLEFLDPDLCEITETITTNGLRTIEFDYKFKDYVEDKRLFRLGNKIWIQGDINLTDCLYVINTQVKQDIYKENSFTFEAEEVLVELNNAPLTSHLDLTTYSSVFKTRTVNGALEVKVDWNSLNYWFGEFYNLGVVQDCLNSTVQWIPFYGTFNIMSLLRYIEEQTGNVFITRYEKDQVNNTIHRYLDFLNPINVSKNWELHLEYDFLQEMVSKFYSDYGETETTEDKAWNIVRYTNSHVPTGQTETVEAYDPEAEAEILAYDTLDTSYEWISSDETVIDEGTIKHYPTYNNIVPANIQFQIATPLGEVLNADGTIYQTGDDNPLIWSASDIGLTTSNTHCLITLSLTDGTLGVCLNDRSFAVVESIGGNNPTYVSYNSSISEDTTSGNKRNNSIIPDDCYFEIYNTVTHQVLYRTQINRSIGQVHEEVLDFTHNLDNIIFNIDETDTYTAVAPILQYDAQNSSGVNITRDNFTDLITRYKNLTISKGQTIPMIMQKITVEALTLEAAKMSFNTSSSIAYIEGSGANESILTDNYWVRPYNPNDNINEDTTQNSTFEFWRATAYWYAPYAKKGGDLQVSLDGIQNIEYNVIHGRPDTRTDFGTVVYDKTGTTSSSDEDIYSIYNQVVLYLKDHSTPNIDLDVEVANLSHTGIYNDYDIWDKIYIKVPGTAELITATITETKKEAHDIASNTIKVSNYTTNTIKTIANTTVINAPNTNFKYPNSKTLTVQLENVDYDSEDPYSVQYPANKLLSFTLYSVENGSRNFKKIYTKRTNAYGQATINMKYDPGDYEIDVSFSGDEEYLETTATAKINVGGVKKVVESNTTTSTSKTTTTQKKTTYYDKYGRTPDKSKILAIGKKSSSGDNGESGKFYGQEFKNYCPKCGKTGTLMWGIFWAGNEHSNWGRFPGTGNKEGGSAEGHIFCSNQRCDGDFSCQGNEHGFTNKKLTTTKKRFLSSKSDAYTLKKGKYVYESADSSNDSKNNANSKNRKVIGTISTKVKNLALEIVGDKTGYSALKAIVEWMDKNIWYKYYCGFCKSPDQVLNGKHGNCCDQTRLILQLFDGAGLSEYYNLYYCHVPNHVYAIVTSKSTGTKTYIDPASDYHTAYGYVCQGYQKGSPSSSYPKLPFSGCGGC